MRVGYGGYFFCCCFKVSPYSKIFLSYDGGQYILGGGTRNTRMRPPTCGELCWPTLPRDLSHIDELYVNLHEEHLLQGILRPRNPTRMVAAEGCVDNEYELGESWMWAL